MYQSSTSSSNNYIVTQDVSYKTDLSITVSITREREGGERMNRPDGTKIAKVIQVIETKAMRGLGSEKDPVREVSQYWDFDGKFLAEMDAEHCIPIIEHDANAIKESISSEQIIASQPFDKQALNQCAKQRQK